MYIITLDNKAIAFLILGAVASLLTLVLVFAILTLTIGNHQCLENQTDYRQKVEVTTLNQLAELNKLDKHLKKL